MGGVRGDFAGLARLKTRIAKAARPEFEAKVAQSMAAAALKQLADGFRKSRSPYGEKWAKLKSRKGKPLLDTGRMRASTGIAPRPGGFEIFVTAGYASYHQHGTRRLPQRQMIPDASRGLGPIWGKAIRAAARERVRRQFLGRRSR